MLLDTEVPDPMAPVFEMVDVTMRALAKKKFATDPIVAPRYSSITSIVSSAYKRHGNIIEQALAATLRHVRHLTVWDEPFFCVSEAAERLASGDATALGAVLPYSLVNPVRTLQVDFIVFNSETGHLGAYESKRGFGYHDAGKIRSMKRDMRCLQMLTKSYGQGRGLHVKNASAHMIFYYGQCSIPKPLSLTGKELDENFGFPVWESVERVNIYFREKLDALLATI
jgi:hypothetical protein